jgi:glycosyltransferase involved in cell wall biosynthesis
MKNILHVTHCWGGGIPVYISDLKEAFQGDYNIFVLKCGDGKVVLEHGTGSKNKDYYRLQKPLSLTEIANSDYRKVIRLILQAYGIDLVHVHITLGHSFDIYKISKEMNIPVIYTVHEFFHICPTFHMIDRNGQYCNGCEYGNENDECLKNHPYINNPSFDGKMLKKWRREFMKVKESIDYFIFPSFSCKKIFSSFFDIEGEKCKVIYHGTSFEKKESSCKDSTTHLRVGILGSILKHKGEKLFKFILRNIKDEKIKFYHYGEGFLKSSNLINYGAYERSEILEMLKRDQIDVILLLSTWPETFSYTLTESVAAGIPPVVTNLGALKERVEKGGIGWVVDYKVPQKICDLLRFIRVNRSEINARRERIKEFPLKSISEMKNKTFKIYKSVLKKKVAHKSDASQVKRTLRALEKIECRPVTGDESQTGPAEIFLKSLSKKI